MKKVSNYNFYIPLNETAVLAHNTISGSYILLNKSIYNLLTGTSENIKKLEETQPKLYNQMYEFGYIIDFDFNELLYIQNYKLNSRFNKNIYNVTVNPSMNCNMNCWYCYESHLKNSSMTFEIAEKILTHLKNHHAATHYEMLNLSFFGGEPFLNFKITKYLLENILNFSQENNIKLHVSFTTNATCITENMLHFLKQFKTSFQITFDGAKEKHNTVRQFKASKNGSFETIISTLKNITHIMEDYHVNIRVNYDKQTLQGIEYILDDLEFMDRKKTIISLQKIWQEKEYISSTKIIDFISSANQKRFKVKLKFIPEMTSSVCYADNLNQIVVNYNGDIFKCTARDFSEENREGVLLSNGTINWNTEAVIKRMGLTTPEMCLKCKLYPCCGGFCSQKMLESKDEFTCHLPKDLSHEDLIVLNFNQSQLSS